MTFAIVCFVLAGVLLTASIVREVLVERGRQRRAARAALVAPPPRPSLRRVK